MTVGPATSVKQQQKDNVTLVTRRLRVDSAGTERMLRYIDLMFTPNPTRQRYEEMTATVQWARANGVADQFFEPTDIPSSVAGLDSLWVVHNAYDPGPDLSRLAIPILAFYGENDEVVPPASNVPLLRRYAATARNDRVRIVVVPGGDHGLNQRAGRQTLPGGAVSWRFSRVGAQVLDEALRFLRSR
jgi:pimeloyl-ACP methyl ester carboxylesterase